MSYLNEGSILKKRQRTPEKNYGHGYDMEAIEAHVEISKQAKRCPPQPYLTIDQVQQKIQAKIEGLSPRASDQQRRIHALFGRAQELNSKTFKKLVERLGFTLTDAQSDGLFKKLDVDDNGGISLTEFLRGILPKDTTANSWHDKRRDQEAMERTKRREAADANSFRLAMAGSNRSPKEIADLVANRIIALTAKPTDQMRKIRRIFAAYGQGTGKSKELGPKELQNQLMKIEIVLSNKEAERFFKFLDDDNSGSVSMTEFFAKCNPSGWSEQPWYIQARDDQHKALHDKKQAFRNSAEEYQKNFRTPSQPELTPAQIKQKISDKVKQLSRTSSDQVRKVTRIFKQGLHKSDNPDLSEPEFREHVAMLGISMTPEQSKALFKEFDKDNSGDISLVEFLSGVLGNDSHEDSWHARSLEQQKKAARAKKEIVKQGPKFYQSGPIEHLTVKGCIQLIRDKIVSYSSRQSDQTRQILRLFGFGGECTKSEFHEKLQRLGITLHQHQLDEIFKEFDINQNGLLSIQEFLMSIFPEEIGKSSFLNKRQELEITQKSMSKARKQKLSRGQFRQNAHQGVDRPVKSLKTMIHDRIVQRSKKPSDQLRKVRNIFATSGDNEKLTFGQKGEMSMSVLKEQLAVLGVIMTETEAQALFDSIDTDKSGGISMLEFLRAILPEEFSEKPWWEKARDKEQKMLYERRRKEEQKRKDISSYIGAPTFSNNAPMSNIIDQIRMRVDCRTSRSSDTVRQLMRRFQKAAVIDPEKKKGQIQMTREDFKDQMKILGVHLTDEQSNEIFSKFDEDHSESVDLVEFISNIHQDYTGESYFEKRPNSSPKKRLNKRMLGATDLTRRDSLQGSGVNPVYPAPQSPFKEKEERRQARIKAKVMENNRRKQQMEQFRPGSFPCFQGPENDEEVVESMTTKDYYTDKQQSTEKKMCQAKRLRLEGLLKQSLGEQTKTRDKANVKSLVRKNLRKVETGREMAKVGAKRSEKPVRIVRGSPRSWTGNLRSNASVYIDASSKPQYYDVAFKVGDGYAERAKVPQPPKSVRPTPRSSPRKTPRTKTSGKQDALQSPRYVTRGGGAPSPRLAVVQPNYKLSTLPTIQPTGMWTQAPG